MVAKVQGFGRQSSKKGCEQVDGRQSSVEQLCSASMVARVQGCVRSDLNEKLLLRQTFDTNHTVKSGLYSSAGAVFPNMRAPIAAMPWNGVLKLYYYLFNSRSRSDDLTSTPLIGRRRTGMTTTLGCFLDGAPNLIGALIYQGSKSILRRV